MNTEFNIGDTVQFTKLKGKELISGELKKFLTDKKTGKIYALVSREGKNFTCQLSKLKHP